MAEALNKLGGEGLVLGSLENADVTGSGANGKVVLFASGSGAASKMYYKGPDGATRNLGTDIESLTALTGSGNASLDGSDLIMVADQDRAEGNEVKVTMTQLGDFLAGSVTSSGLIDSNGQLFLSVPGLTESDTVADGNQIIVYNGAQLRKMSRADFIESAALDSINIDGGAIDGTPIGANAQAAGQFTTLLI